MIGLSLFFAASGMGEKHWLAYAGYMNILIHISRVLYVANAISSEPRVFKGFVFDFDFDFDFVATLMK